MKHTELVTLRKSDTIQLNGEIRCEVTYIDRRISEIRLCDGTHAYHITSEVPWNGLIVLRAMKSSDEAQPTISLQGESPLP